MLNKIKEFSQINDIYFLKAVNNKIIVNHNYSGILIFNDNLELEKELYLFEDLIIYPYLLYVNNSEFLIYCYENMKLVYVNLDNFECKIISLTEDIKEIIFSKAYEWNQEKIFLSSYDNQFFEVNLKKCLIKKISVNKIKNSYYDFYTFYKVYKSCICEKHSVEIFKDNRTILVYREKKNDNLIIIRYNKNRYVSNKMHINIDINFYNIIYEKYILAAVDENIIEIVTKKDKEKLILKSEYMYSGAALFQKDDKMFLIVSVSDKSSVEYSKLILYEV